MSSQSACGSRTHALTSATGEAPKDKLVPTRAAPEPPKAPARPPPPAPPPRAAQMEDQPVAQLEDFSSIEKLNIFTSGGWCSQRCPVLGLGGQGNVCCYSYQCRFLAIIGVDKQNRLLVVFSMCNLPPRDQIDLDKLIRSVFHPFVLSCVLSIDTFSTLLRRFYDNFARL